MKRVTVDGKAYELDGTTLLDAVRAAGADVPTICQHDRLSNSGACRMCLVRLEGKGAPVAACVTPLADGQAIVTDDPVLENARKFVLEMTAHRYPGTAVEHDPGAAFHQMLHRYAVSTNGHVPDPALVDDSHPYLHVDMNQCIACMRCVRVCDEIQGESVWKVANRGAHTWVHPDGPTMLESSCVSCGACADVCPTGAILDRTVLEQGRPTEWTKTVCAYCGVGCEINAGTKDGQLVQILPSAEGRSNVGHTCVKGRYAWGFVQSDARARYPMMRERGQDWRRVTWDEALTHIADTIRKTVAERGADKIMMLSSARGSNEENYVAQKFVRAGLHTHNIDCCARVCHAPTAAAMRMSFGTGAATGAFEDIDLAKTIIISGSNALEAHPVVGVRLRRAVRNGANLIVIDPRKVGLAQKAHLHLPITPGANVAMFHSMASVIVEEGLQDDTFINGRTEGYAAYAEFLKGYTPEKCEAVTGVPAALVRAAARMYATGGPSISFHGLGLTENIQGTEGIVALSNLALLTGNVGKPGAGVNPLRGQNNVQGSAHMGCDPNYFTGYDPISNNAARVRFESFYGHKLPEARGLDAVQLVEAAEAGNLDVLWAIGYDIMQSHADIVRTQRVLEHVPLVVVQDLFMNETARAIGTVFLPAAASFEKDGTFMNSERRVQRIRKAVEPQGEAQPDWVPVCEVAKKLGFEGFGFKDAREIWNEVRSVWPQGAGISYEKMEREGGIQWPCPDESHPGTVRLHTSTFTLGDRAPFHRPEQGGLQEMPTAEYPLLLVTGRNLYSYNASTMTDQTRNIELRPIDTLDLHPVDADRLGIHDGDLLRIVSAWGEAQLPAKRDTRVQVGQLFCTFHTPAAHVNRLLGPHRDNKVNTPAYKRTAVRLEKLAKTTGPAAS
ncbi:MAG: formate dehydrogenase subunit alpha [Candidatus Eisenbacteria bacterium]